MWNLTEDANTKSEEELAIKMACDCPAGRLVMIDKRTNKPIEEKYEPSIVILQDQGRKCSGPIWVRGGIQLEDTTGHIFEKRNRVTLCRCGKSENKPFCDANHININFQDKINHS